IDSSVLTEGMYSSSKLNMGSSGAFMCVVLILHISSGKAGEENTHTNFDCSILFLDSLPYLADEFKTDFQTRVNGTSNCTTEVTTVGKRVCDSPLGCWLFSMLISCRKSTVFEIFGLQFKLRQMDITVNCSLASPLDVVVDKYLPKDSKVKFGKHNAKYWASMNVRLGRTDGSWSKTDDVYSSERKYIFTSVTDKSINITLAVNLKMFSSFFRFGTDTQPPDIRIREFYSSKASFECELHSFDPDGYIFTSVTGINPSDARLHLNWVQSELTVAWTVGYVAETLLRELLAETLNCLERIFLRIFSRNFFLEVTHPHGMVICSAGEFSETVVEYFTPLNGLPTTNMRLAQTHSTILNIRCYEGCEKEANSESKISIYEFHSLTIECLVVGYFLPFVALIAHYDNKTESVLFTSRTVPEEVR
ncbi:unnamed protein product, partial [Allacma fusca]